MNTRQSSWRKGNMSQRKGNERYNR